jgi:hypothetical protein
MSARDILKATLTLRHCVNVSARDILKATQTLRHCLSMSARDILKATLTLRPHNRLWCGNLMATEHRMKQLCPLPAAGHEQRACTEKSQGPRQVSNASNASLTWSGLQERPERNALCAGRPSGEGPMVRACERETDSSPLSQPQQPRACRRPHDPGDAAAPGRQRERGDRARAVLHGAPERRVLAGRRRRLAALGLWLGRRGGRSRQELGRVLQPGAHACARRAGRVRTGSVSGGRTAGLRSRVRAPVQI